MSRNRGKTVCDCGEDLVGHVAIELAHHAEDVMGMWAKCLRQDEYFDAIGLSPTHPWRKMNRTNPDRPVDDARYRFFKYECPTCGRMYACWCERDPGGEIGISIYDTSYWSTFNDEPGPEDGPTPRGDYVEDENGPTVTVYPSGIRLHPFDARDDEIRIGDIAHALSLVCRFGGACREFYSVAQHSVLVLTLGERLINGTVAVDGGSAHEFRRLLLMHDAEEYVFGDMIAPVKSRCPDYRSHARRFRQRIFRRFGIRETETLWNAVKRVDREARILEAAFLGKAPDPSDPPIAGLAEGLLTEAWSPVSAKGMFLHHTARLAIE